MRPTTKRKDGELAAAARGRLVGVCAVLAVLLVSALAVGQGDLGAASGLFQSAVTPTMEQTATSLPETSTATPSPEAPIATAEPATPEPTSPPPTAVPELPTTEPLPSDTPAAAIPPGEVEATAAVPEATEEEPDTSAGAEAEPPGRYPDEESPVRFEWDTLFDSLALGLSYGWLCCGVVLLIALPGFFLALWARGKREQEPEEGE